MPSLIQGFEYDVFISYRQNDNRSGWVSQFVEDLREELASTIKDPVNIYFDENPHDGLQDTHHVDKSLEGKLRCIVFMPVLSRTYCDAKCFAWNHEFLEFLRVSKEDTLGGHVHLRNGNVSLRVLPIQIHEIDLKDQQLFEEMVQAPLRTIDFTFKSPGVNRPLLREDLREDHLSKLVYRDQINKTANALAQIMVSLSQQPATELRPGSERGASPPDHGARVGTFLHKVKRRNVLRAGVVYVGLALVINFMVSTYVSGAERLIPLLGIFSAVGLVVAMVLAWLFERSPEGWVRTSSESSLRNPYLPHQRKPLTAWWTIAALGIVIVYFLAQPKDVNEKSIAVLPFEFRGGSSSEAYLSDAFSEDIVNNLYLIGGVRVISYSSARSYKDTKKTAREIAKELQVATLLTGSIWKENDRLKITVELQDGSSNELIWAKSYQKTVVDLLAIQTEVTRQVARVLQIKINERAESKLRKLPLLNSTAYDHFAKARNLYTYSNADSMERAIQEYKLAVTLDPDYAQAYAGLADAYLQLHARFAKGIHWTDSAIEAAQSAIRIDSNQSDGYKALGAANFSLRKYDEAMPWFKKAIEKNPYNAQAIGNLGAIYFIRLEYADALKQYKRSARLNPQAPVSLQALGWIYRLLGDLEQAESYLKLSLERRPLWDTYRELAYTYLSQGRNKDAINLIPEILKLGNRGTRPLEIAGRVSHFAGDFTNAKSYFQEAIKANPSYANDASSVSSIGLGQLLLQEGNTAEADIYLSHGLELYLGDIAKGLQDDDPPFNVAAIKAIQGNKPDVLKYLTLAIDRKWIDIVQVEKGPYFEKYRSDPDVLILVDQVRNRLGEIRKNLDQP